MNRLEFWTILIRNVGLRLQNFTSICLIYLFLCYYVAIAYQYLNSCLATVPQVLFTNLRDNIKARYQTLPDLVVKGNFPLFFMECTESINVRVNFLVSKKEGCFHSSLLTIKFI